MLQIKIQHVDSDGSRVAPNHNQGKSAKLVLLNINRKVSSARKYSIFGCKGALELAPTRRRPLPV